MTGTRGRTSADTPILEVGGTHVAAAWVNPDGWLARGVLRRDLDAQAGAERLIGAIAAAGAELGAAPGADWGVAMPGPFDYERGIAAYADVGKFDSLAGLDVRAGLSEALPARPGSITFVNDASAFLIGEWLAGAAEGADRCVALTLGTGIGSAFLHRGVIVDQGPLVPPQAEADLLVHEGYPLEHWVSRRAIRRRYAEIVPPAGVPGGLDVHEITALARLGDLAANRVIHDAFRLLGEIVGPWLDRFGAEVLVVGGSISRAFDLIESPLRDGLASAGNSTLSVRLAADPELSPLIGAAYPAVTRSA